MNIPVFVVTGAQNKGKSTFVKALTGDNSIAVGEKSGLTKNSKYYRPTLYGASIEIWDTPGFENSPDTYDKLYELGVGESGEPLKIFKTFISKYEMNSDFEKEAEILKPIIENNACIIYVADCSKPFSEDEYLREVQILEMTNLPIIGILNPILGEDYISEWEKFLRRRFNGVEKFNPHKTTFNEIVRILSHFSHLNKDWKESVDDYIKALRRERENKLTSSAERIRIGILEILNADYKIKVDSNLNKEENETILTKEVRKSINKLLAKTRRDLLKTFDIDVEIIELNSMKEIDVFDEAVRKRYVPKEQQAIIGAILGSSLGLGVDVIFGFAGGGVPTIVGGVTGGAIGYLRGFSLMRIDWSDLNSWTTFRKTYFGNNEKTEDQYLQPKYLSPEILVIIINSSRELVKELYNRTIVNKDKIEIQFVKQDDKLVKETKFLEKLCKDGSFRKKDKTKKELDDLILSKLKLDQENS